MQPQKTIFNISNLRHFLNLYNIIMITNRVLDVDEYKSLRDCKPPSRLLYLGPDDDVPGCPVCGIVDVACDHRIAHLIISADRFLDVQLGIVEGLLPAAGRRGRCCAGRG